MGFISRGVKNTFRNSLRTVGFSIIIAVSMGLAFSMLLANQAVRDRGDQLREDIGANLQVFPSGSFGSQGGGKPLTDADADKLKRLPDVKSVTKTMNFAVQNTDETDQNAANGSTFSSSDGSQGPPTTSLLSSIDPAELYKGVGRNVPKTIPPIIVNGVTGERDTDGKKINLTKGQLPSSSDKHAALVGQALAEKNALKVGSTFTINDTTLTVKGIFDTGTLFSNNKIIIPFDTARTLMDRKDEVQGILVTASSLDTLAAVGKNIEKTLGDDRVDVTPLQQEAVRLAASLKSIENISFTTLIIALAAGALTILLTMVLIVRERIREIGILKALGATNVKIVGQFLAEATVLTLLGTTIGMAFAALTSNAILSGLLDSRLDGASASGGLGQMQSQAQSLDNPKPDMQALAENITTLVDWHFITYGLGIALLIAIIGTALPALLIAKVRPAQIMRGN